MNSMKRHTHINELFDCNRKILASIFLFSTNSLISSGICSTPKLSEYIIPDLLQNKAIQYVPTSLYSSRFFSYASSFTFYTYYLLKNLH